MISWEMVFKFWPVKTEDGDWRFCCWLERRWIDSGRIMEAFGGDLAHWSYRDVPNNWGKIK